MSEFTFFTQFIRFRNLAPDSYKIGFQICNLNQTNTTSTNPDASMGKISSVHNASDPRRFIKSFKDTSAYNKYKYHKVEEGIIFFQLLSWN